MSRKFGPSGVKIAVTLIPLPIACFTMGTMAFPSGEKITKALYFPVVIASCIWEICLLASKFASNVSTLAPIFFAAALTPFPAACANALIWAIWKNATLSPASGAVPPPQAAWLDDTTAVTTSAAIASRLAIFLFLGISAPPSLVSCSDVGGWTWFSPRRHLLRALDARWIGRIAFPASSASQPSEQQRDQHDPLVE